MNPSALEIRACPLGDKLVSAASLFACPAVLLLNKPCLCRAYFVSIFYFQWKTDRLTLADSADDCVSLKEEFTEQIHSMLIDRGKGMTRFTTSKRGQVALGLYTLK